MGSLSISTHRGLVQWQRLLLVVSLLTFWSPPTTAKIDVKWTFASEGGDALLQIENKPPEAIGIVWYKGEDLHHKNIVAFLMKTTHYHLSGPGRKGEEMLTHDGSLLLKNVTKRDAGRYTVVAHLPDSKTETGFGKLDVYEAFGAITGTTQGTVLSVTCTTELPTPNNSSNNDNYKRNWWLKRKTKLSQHHRNITIDPIRKEDAGDDYCQVSHPSVLFTVRPLEMDVKY